MINEIKADIICRCSGTTKAKIKHLVENGIDNLDDVSRSTGACSGCGACDFDVLEFIRSLAISPSPPL